MRPVDGSQVTPRVRLTENRRPEKRQPFGERSRHHLAKLCFERHATVRPTARDRYAGSCRACDGVDANLEQLRAEMAWRFVRYATDPAFVDVEARAREPG